MKRKDIKIGLAIIYTTAIVCTVAVFSLAYLKQRQLAPEEKETVVETIDPEWSERLTNELSDAPGLDRMDHDIERFLGKWNIKGMSVAVTRNDSLIYAKGYGMADVEEGRPMTPQNIMRMASASKLVTAIAIMRLVEEGRLRLNSKVFGPDGLLNDSAYTNAIKDTRLFDVTVDHLLQHKGGFGLGAGDPMFNTKDIIALKNLPGPPSNEELTEIVLGRKLAFSPGKGFRYSNFGYMLLSLVIEKVTGRDYWEFVTDEVLHPAGCYRFRPATNYYADRNDDEVHYYGPDNVPVEEYNGSGRMVERVYGGSNVNGLVGAGGWCASASDLARLVAATDKYPYVGNIISDESIDSLTAYAKDDKISRGWSEINETGKWKRTGTLSSTHTLIERFPNGECWVLLTNSGVYKGHHFSREMTDLVSDLRARYSATLPRRDLWARPQSGE
ncbi:MAG: beta-lactamase family protein [Muribaculaceae bacterium]|nr:beta-lactamase family protein [Muribaculaceae bacterium]MDE6552956.1 beta-lactamase family protein [Muribaculaceae bacterium]